MSAKSESDKAKKKRSACWYFYDQNPSGGFCRICQKQILTQAGGTTNLRNHLRRKHGELWTAIMENRLDPATLAITEHRQSTSHGEATSEEELNSTAAPSENNTSVATLQAYRDVHGNTVLYLHPAPEGEPGLQLQNAQIHAIANSEAIPTNGEMVSVAVPKDVSTPEVRGEAKAQEESTPIVIHAPVKNYQGSSALSRTIARQSVRPSPMSPSANSNNNNNNNDSCSKKEKEDTYDAFGKYIASMLRALPPKDACKLQGQIVNWILKEQINNTS